MRDVQPLLAQKCSRCHAADGGPVLNFVDSYSAIRGPSVKCPGELVGGCVKLALKEQAPESAACRTYTTPFHREAWVCLTPVEIDRVASWVDAGMLER